MRENSPLASVFLGRGEDAAGDDDFALKNLVNSPGASFDGGGAGFGG
jgi:hypothetical protein